jgi:type I restriction enzyme S subunit
MASEEWGTVPLGIVTVNFDSSRVPVRESERRPGPYPYYGASGIIDHVDDYLFDGTYLLVAEDGENLRSRNTPVAFLASGKFWVNNHAHVLQAGHGALTEYLAYSLGQAEIDGYLTGSAQPKLTRKSLDRIPVILPPLDDQRAIVRILGALDSKIDLNWEMNRALEHVARALFKSWFVDFDPVVVKAGGLQPSGMTSEVAMRFPSTFTQTPEEPLPRGWRSAPIYEVAEVRYGAPFSSKHFNMERRGHPLVRIRDLVTQRPEVFTDEVHPNGRKIDSGDILVGMDGEFRPVIWKGGEAWLNQRVCQFIPRGTAGTAFVYLSILEPLAEFERSKVGTTVTHLGKADIDTFRVIHPGDAILSQFTTLTQPLIERSLANAAEARLLTDLRDALLPRLLSGEIRLNKAERVVEQVI